MFEKKGIKYAFEETIGTECLSKPIEDFSFIDLVDEQQEKAQCYKDGATFGYNKGNEWHNIRENPNDLPTDTSALYYVLVYSWTFGFSHLYKRYGFYIPTVCEWDGEYFKALDRDAYTNARNIKNCIAWKEIVLPKEIKEK